MMSELSDQMPRSGHSGVLLAGESLGTQESQGAYGLYTPLSAIDHLQAGQRSEHLVREVLRFVRAPNRLLRRLSARSLVLFRPIATPTFEMLRFLELAQESCRSPAILELSCDWFTPAVNPSKRRLGKLEIHQNRTEGPPRTARPVRVVSFNDRGRQRLCDMVCDDGTPFVAFHHDLLASVAGESALAAVIDATEFYGTDGPRSHYERAFALYTCFGALAESFALSGPEQAFTEEIVLPAFEATTRRFGARPAIAELLPRGCETHPQWEGYPAAVMTLALRASGR